MFYSPLRYPGGKSKLTPFVLETIKINQLDSGIYVEPFAGGAGIALFLLLEKYVKKIYINDLDPYIHAFWYSILQNHEEFCRLIEETDITMDEWYKHKEIFNSKTGSLFEKGFAAFFLNRTNRSGIIKGGVIGGKAQMGNFKIDCRFNKTDLIERIINISEHKDQIVLTNLDAIEFIEEVLPEIEMKGLVNIDPPYYLKGKGLYRNFFNHEDHLRLYRSISNIKHPWIVTYDNTPEINDIYSEKNPQPFGLSYTAQTKRKGQEIIMHSPNLTKCSYDPAITFTELKREKRNKFKKAI